jgi:uncharacterized membrane protein
VGVHRDSWPIQYVLAVVAFCLVDLVWLGLVAPRLYEHFLGDLLAPEADALAAGAFYALFVAGLVFFVVRPALERESLRRAVGAGAFFGLVTYATWDLTNLAVLRDFPAALVPIDLAWGAFVSATVSALTYVAVRRLPVPARGPSGKGGSGA